MDGIGLWLVKSSSLSHLPTLEQRPKPRPDNLMRDKDKGVEKWLCSCGHRTIMYRLKCRCGEMIPSKYA